MVFENLHTRRSLGERYLCDIRPLGTVFRYGFSHVMHAENGPFFVDAMIVFARTEG